MSINNLVKWFVKNVLRQNSAPNEPRVFPSLIEGGDFVSTKGDEKKLDIDFGWDWDVEEEVSLEIIEHEKKPKKLTKTKNKIEKKPKKVAKKTTKKIRS